MKRPTPHAPYTTSATSTIERYFSISAFALAVVMAASWGGTTPARAEQYQVEITQVDRVSINRLGVYVSITDSEHNPIPAMGELVLSEAGREVFRTQLGDQNVPAKQDSSVVLVLDVSSSMAGTKLEQAKQAAREYVRNRHPDCRIAIVTFHDFVHDYPFTTDTGMLTQSIDNLVVGGSTAFFDGVGRGLDLVQSTQGATRHHRPHRRAGEREYSLSRSSGAS